MAIITVKRPFKLESLPLDSATQGLWDFSSGSLLDLSAAKNNLTGAPAYSNDSGVLAYNPTGILATDRLSLADTVITDSSHFAFWAIIKRELGSTLRTIGRGKDGSGNGWSVDGAYTDSGYLSQVVIFNAGYSATAPLPFPEAGWQFVATILQQAAGIEPSHVSSMCGSIIVRTGLAGLSILRTSTVGAALGVGANEGVSSGGGSFVALSGIENLAGMTEANALARLATIRDTLLPRFNLPQRRRIYVDVASGGVLTPSLFTDSDTFYAATVTPGAVTLTPALFTNTNTFYSPVVASSIGLTPVLFADGDTFYNPSVAAGAVTLTPSLFADADTFYIPAVTTDGALLPSIFTNSNAFFTSTVTPGAVSLTPTIYTDPDTFHAATIAAGGSLFPAVYVDADTFYPHVVAAGAVNLTPSLFADADTFYAPSISGSVSLVPSLFVDADTFYSASISQGQVLLPALFADADTFYVPSVVVGAVSLLPSFYASANTFYVTTIGAAVTWPGEAFNFASPITQNFIFTSSITKTLSFDSPI